MDERAAIFGAGPAGFYAAGMLLAAGFHVELFDVLPTPYGLVRAGVAPDHPKIKNVTKVFDKSAAHEHFRFFGGVELGRDVTREDLMARYQAVVYSIGTNSDNRLGIPGEDLPGSHSATEFVAWYNAHPHHAEREFNLDVERAVVVGNGNVAIDVARMLVLHPDELRLTDTADHAIGALVESAVTDVVVLGRRGPAQAAFTNPELRELGELTRADVIVDPRDVDLDAASQAWLESDAADGRSRRNVEILKDYAQREPKGDSHRVVLSFLRSPLEILGDGRVEAVRVGVNRIEDAGDGRLKAVPTGEEETIECGLVVRSIGYRGQPLAGIPFDDKRGLIRNDGGRVTGDDGTPLPGEYVAGWIKRGPSGVIGTNKKDAAETVAKIVEDRDAGALNTPTETEQAVDEWLDTKIDAVVSWEGWQNIDRHETELGAPHGRPRVKLVTTKEMHEIARGD